jgi:hypothetical protein
MHRASNPLNDTAEGQLLTLRFGPFELDVRSGELRRNGTTVRLQPQPFKVLVLLACRPGEPARAVSGLGSRLRVRPRASLPPGELERRARWGRGLRGRRRPLVHPAEDARHRERPTRAEDQPAEAGHHHERAGDEKGFNVSRHRRHRLGAGAGAGRAGGACRHRRGRGQLPGALPRHAAVAGLRVQRHAAAAGRARPGVRRRLRHDHLSYSSGRGHGRGQVLN